MKHLFRIIILTISIGYGQSSIVNAQTLSPKVTPTSGGYATGGGNSLSWTMGETFTTTLSGGGKIVTQGEQQPEIDLLTGNITASLLCAGSTVSVPYIATGYVDAGNVFTAQLSNAGGSFASPVNIGALTSTLSGTITATIPVATAAGNNYHIRVSSNKPDYTGKMSATAITISTAPPAGTVHVTATPTVGCVGGTDVISVNAVTGATFYNWSSSTSGILFNGNPTPYQSASPSVTISYTALPQAGSSGWSVCAFAGNACGNSNTICSWIRSTISRPSSITGNAIGCPGTTAIGYSCPFVSGAANYLWSSSSADMTVNGSGQNVTVDFSPTFSSATLCVHAQTSCGYNSADYCISISKTTAVPGAITGASYVCPNASSTFSVAAVAGAASYNWSCSVPGSVVTPSGNSCSILFPSTVPVGSLVSVTAASSCGAASTVRSKGIGSGIPNTPGNISGLSAGQCGQLGVSYSITPVSLATGYLWTATGGATVNGPNNLSAATIDFPASFTSCTISVAAASSCGTGAARSIVVSGVPNTPASITSGSNNFAPCHSDVVTYCALGSTNATSYIWTIPVGASILGPATGSCIIVQWGSTGGTITCKATNACGQSGTKTQAITVSCREAQVMGSVDGFNAQVYPNPTDGKLTIKFSSMSSEKFLLNVADVAGRILLNESLTSEEGANLHEIDLSSFAKGVYVVHLSGENRSEVIRVNLE